MIWLTWRQHRLEALIAGAVVFALASILIIAGLRASPLLDLLDACHRSLSLSPEVAQRCDQAVLEYREALGWAPLLPVALILLPALAGSYLPAPMLAREYERGTTKLAWAQGITRTRWLVTKSVLYATAFVLAALLLGALAPFAQPAWTTGGVSMFGRGPSPFFLFEWQWPLLLGSALFAVGLGLASAAVTRRILASMFITVILFGAARLLVAIEVRPNYLPPLVVTSSSAVPQDAWRLESAALDSTGRIVAPERMRELPSEYFGDPSLRRGSYEDYLTTKGITFRNYYQPADRFWLFQVIEGTLFASLGVGLFVLALWLVRRRPA
jgi:hypothetical protein